jgi:outer membrane lipoprotein SlyB
MSQLYVDNIRNRTGGPIGIPTGAVVTGILTATSFSGDGSELTGVSGFANALSSDQTSALNKVFKTPFNLEVAADETIQSDAASDNIAFMREGRIHVQNGAVLTVKSGTTVLMNILSIFP